MKVFIMSNYITFYEHRKKDLFFHFLVHLPQKIDSLEAYKVMEKFGSFSDECFCSSFLNPLPLRICDL